MLKYHAKTLLASMLALSFCHVASADTGLLRQPAISRDHLAFVYSGDIWLADRDGKNPRRLTNHPAAEFAPMFSPDGKWLAFSASYDKNTDVYVMPAEGGEARRLTWHPGVDTVVGWSADSKRIVFASNREIAVSRSTHLYEVALEGGEEKKFMEAIAHEGSWSADGKWLAYRPYPQAYAGAAGWRQHRGGTTPPIWLIDAAKQQWEKIPHENASDKSPVWVGDNVYFISDRNDGVANIFVYQRASKTVQQVSRETEWDVRNLTAYDNKLVYEVGGKLKELDTQNGQIKTLAIDLSALAAQAYQVRPHWKDASPYITSAQLSPSAKRVVVSARGEVFTVPVKDGSVRNLTESSGVREKDALWSADGKQIAYISDEGGHHQIVLREQTGGEKSKRYDLGKNAYYSLLEWSPDSQIIVFQDNHLQLFALNLSQGKIIALDKSLRRNQFNVSFSADSRYLAYSVNGVNHYSQIKLYDFQTQSRHTLTDGMSDASNPAFAQDYLYFTASTNTGPAHVGLDMSTQERPLRQGIYALVLAADGKSPLLPKTGDEEVKKAPAKTEPAKTDATKGDGKADAAAEDKAVADGKTAAEKNTEKSNDKASAEKTADSKTKKVKIDFANLSQRIIALPIAERNYTTLKVAADGALFFLERPQPGASNEVPAERSPNSANLYRFNYEDKKAKLVRSGIASFNLSADGKKALLISLGSSARLELADAGERMDAKPISLSDLKMRINPRAEWQQIFNETWWMEKEFFYDANLHGLDWDKVYQRYSPQLKYVQRREDLNDLLLEMIGEMQVGHNVLAGGDVHNEAAVNVGLLGADIRAEKGHYRIQKIYRGDVWNPFLTAPLAAPGLDIKEGDYILAVNGKPLSAAVNFYSAFENMVGKQVQLSLARQFDAQGKPIAPHQVTVQAIANDQALRQWQWIENNRAYVEKKTAGKLAYVYLPNTGADGYQYFNRMFYSQADKAGLIIDERRNGGGQAANYITEILARPYLAGWKDRDALIFNTPGAAIMGPKAMLIDQDAGSGGDFLPYSFKRLGLGNLIGKRTWGGLIGVSINPGLIDGGHLAVPYFRFFTPDGEWRIENEGVAPDIEVEQNPLEVNRGVDPQLDAAIADVMAKLKTYRDPRLQQAPAPAKLGK